MKVTLLTHTPESLSARRAWIEIALTLVVFKFVGSLSARRAWIEMEVENGFAGVLFVALRKESVDRNCCDAAESR